ncbi:MAG: chemotaxis protein CheV [Eubacterium sp.]|nr:chemotaxis protein CheV [Eubacterium sp.]
MSNDAAANMLEGELQLLEFEVGGNHYGINIAKVQEIMMRRQLVPIPNSPEEIEGVFMPRDQLITIVDLHKVLKLPVDENERGLFIICRFNETDIGFHVDKVNGIHTTSWSEIEHPPKMATRLENSISTGIVKSDSAIILIIDFDRIIMELSDGPGLDFTGADSAEGKEDILGDKHLVIAEDSDFLNHMIVNSLSDIGFKEIRSFPNGKEAWDYISSVRDTDGDITDKIAAIITDIEMPQMDGLQLTKLIKSDEKLNVIPVFLFSSLINEQVTEKCREAGADGQYSKPQIGMLIQKLVEILS